MMSELPRWKLTMTGNDLHKDCYPQWIRVEDGLPADDQLVIAYSPLRPWNGKSGNAETTDIVRYIDEAPFCIPGYGDVTHWIPIPEPPSVRIEQ